MTQAFPSGHRIFKRPDYDPGGNFHEMQHAKPLHPGMTLRDYFAAKAMQSLITDRDTYMAIAKASYEMADAMLKAREEAK
jgi:hypothetical protein